MSSIEILTIDQALEFADLLTADDHEFIATLRVVRRRREVMAWRSLLRSMVGKVQNRLSYDSVGAPYLIDSNLFISVSHSRTHVAVVVSDSKCAVDIESLDRDFERVASRYTTTHERELLAKTTIPPHLHLPLLWSAKEALYKLSGRKGLDLLKDLPINNATPTTIEQLNWMVRDEHVVVYG